jgi:hypothetical protein
VTTASGRSPRPPVAFCLAADRVERQEFAQIGTTVPRPVHVG